MIRKLESLEKKIKQMNNSYLFMFFCIARKKKFINCRINQTSDYEQHLF
jgi:hypothetical protein